MPTISPSAVTSSELDEFMPEFLLLQMEVENLRKNAANPFYNSRYTSLPEVFDNVRPLLNGHGFVVSQFPGALGDQTTVTTIITHAPSCQFISSTMSCIPAKKDPQGVAAAVTLLKRYGLMAILGIASADEDDDGNASVNRPTAKETKLNTGDPTTGRPQLMKPGQEQEQLSAKCIGRWPQIREFLINDGLDAEKAVAEVGKLRAEWAAKADGLANGDKIIKLKEIIKFQDQYAQNANITFKD